MVAADEAVVAAKACGGGGAIGRGGGASGRGGVGSQRNQLDRYKSGDKRESLRQNEGKRP